jgi:8-oxo-dGTP pyrophosphatase MutT (NUDIX family)
LDEARLLFIRRATHLKKHAGQIAFPGGVVEDADIDLLHTGFRESEEEIGLKRETSKLLAELPRAFTPSGYTLQPFFVATTQREFTPQYSEVDSIHLISVKELLTCPVRVEQREWREKSYRVIYFDTTSVCVWGVTGRITELLLTHFFRWDTPR